MRVLGGFGLAICLISIFANGALSNEGNEGLVESFWKNVTVYLIFIGGAIAIISGILDIKYKGRKK